MFLSVKKGTSIIGLEATDAVLAVVYASIKEEYNNVELDLTFERPNSKIVNNLVQFVRELDNILNVNQEESYSNHIEVHNGVEESPLDTNENISLEMEENSIAIDVSIEDEEEIEEVSEILNFEDVENIQLTDNESSHLEIIEEVTEVEENVVEEVVTEPVAKKIDSPAERMMESLKEEQKNEGIIDLEGDKLNTLAYKDHLVNYMKLGFASNLLMKKAQECNDTAEKSKLFTYCEAIEKRTDEFEMKFKEIGLTTGQIHTFRMEVLREVRKYRNDSIREVCEYVNKLYNESDSLIKNLK